MKSATVAAIFTAVALAAPATTAAFDRTPIRVLALTPDGWGQAITTAEQQLRGRYPGISATYCFGAIMVGHEADSSWISGTTRFWDKLVCAGVTVSGQKFALIYDGKSRTGWIIYRLKGITLAALQ